MLYTDVLKIALNMTKAQKEKIKNGKEGWKEGRKKERKTDRQKDGRIRKDK